MSILVYLKLNTFMEKTNNILCNYKHFLVFMYLLMQYPWKQIAKQLTILLNNRQIIMNIIILYYSS